MKKINYSDSLESMKKIERRNKRKELMPFVIFPLAVGLYLLAAALWRLWDSWPAGY